MPRNSLAFAPLATRRRTRTFVDKETGQSLATDSRPPRPGDQVLVEHNGVLRIGTQEEGVVKLRRGGTVEGSGVRLRKG